MNYEIREMSLGEVLDTGFRLLRNHFALFVGLAFTLTLPTQLITMTFATPDPTLSVAASLLGLSLFMLLVSPIASAAITHAISEVYMSRKVGYRESLTFGLRMLLRLVGTSLLMALLVIVGLLLLILPGIYLMFAYMLLYQVMVVEQRAGWNALTRARDLSRGHLLRIIAIWLVGTILSLAISSVLGIVTTGIPFLSEVVLAVVQAVFAAFISATMVVVYFDIRCRKEAFDLEHLAGLVADTASTPPAVDME